MHNRILYLIERMGPGGTEKQLDALIRGLNRDRFTPFLCTLRPSISHFDELKIDKMELGLKRLASVKSLATIRKLHRFCLHNRVQLIQTFFQDPTIIGAIIKSVLPVKLIGSFRDLGFWRTPVENFKMRMAYPFFDGFIANSHAVKNHFCSFDGIKESKISVIYNGFQRRVQAAAETKGNNERVFNVGIVGNFNRPVKRIQDFIKAAPIVLQKMPNTVFTIVGGGGQRKSLQNLAGDLGLIDKIHFIGMVPDALEFIDRFDVGVITSETEGFSNAVIEYMASGVPVVATRVGGNLELVEDGINGFLYPVGDYRQAAASVIRILNDSALRKSMGATNRYKIATRYTYERMVGKHESYYLKVLKGLND